MNKNFYDFFDENLEQAFKLSEENFSHEDLLKMLKTGNVKQKQIAALKFDCVKNEQDAMAIISNLTGCDGKIREAVALKINQLLESSDDVKGIFSKVSAEVLADASIDINANICRLAVDSAILLRQYDYFSTIYAKKLLSFALNALEELDKFVFRDKKYVINKQLFKLYWCLEGIKYFYEYLDENMLEQILIKSSNQDAFTIREKVAQIVSNIEKYSFLKEKLKSDDNYYVRHSAEISL